MPANSTRSRHPPTVRALLGAALAWLAPGLLFAQSSSCPWPGLTGSFVQPALADSWTGTQWDQEYTYMGDACLDQLVLQWTADSKAHTAVYPTSLTVAGYTYTQNTVHDVVGKALTHADENGVQVFIGLQTNSDWFVNYANNTTWLNNEATIAEALANDLWTKYGSHTSFAGWYLGFELDNLNEPTQTQWNAIASFYTAVGNYLHTLAPGKPVIIAPFFNTAVGMSASGYQTMFQSILSQSPVDIVALQDGIGAGHATVSDLPVWYQAMQNAVQQAGHRVRFWSDAETYVINSGFHPGSIGQLVADMTAEDPYVSNFLSFSYNHYMSPQQVLPAYNATYLNYLATQTVETTPPTAPTSLTATPASSISINLSWVASTDNFGVVGYQLYRNSSLVATLYGTGTTFSDSQLNSGTTYTYALTAFDAAGNFSPQSAAAMATTPTGTVYPTDLALNKPYTASIPADPAYPDINGTKLTDGVYAASPPLLSDTAWQGRNTGSQYTFTIDLGAIQTIHEVNTDWMQYVAGTVLLPQTVTYLVSTDNVNWTPVGQVDQPAVGNGTLAQKYRVTGLSAVSGRYVQIQVQPASASWTLIDEAQVLQ